MSRDDSILNTGMTSVTATPRELQRESKDKVREEVKPFSQGLFDFIELKRSEVLSLRSIVIDNLNPEDGLHAEMLARKKNLDFINGFEAHIKNIIKEPKNKASDEQ
jgi:hypothetical protein